jgi:hypothetical protein
MDYQESIIEVSGIALIFLIYLVLLVVNIDNQ